MQTLTVFGASDDLVETSGIPGDGEFYVLGAQKGRYSGYADVVWDEGRNRFRIHAIYDGCWSFALGISDEDDLDCLPDSETVTITRGGDAAPTYSTRLTVEVPDDAVLEAGPGWSR